MRNLHVLGSLLFVIAFSNACTVQDPSATATTTADETADPDAVSPRANCSTVQFCNAPGADGTRCTQNGCSLRDAENECRSEANSICGGITSPFFIVETGGTRVQVSPSTCSGSALSCGGHCCSTASTFCAGSTCCDGTCRPGCPC